jgi:tetratricopeptide (TPR) repeat protein
MQSKQDDKQSKSELRQAERLFSEQRFAELVKHLAPQIFLYRSDPRYYFLLGVASLYIGDFSGAHSYLLRGKDLDPLNLEMQLGLAITYLHRKDDPQALRLLVDIQDKHPTNKRVLQVLDLLKQAPEKIDWPEQLRLGKLRPLYPGPGFNWRPLLRYAGLGLAGLTGLAMLVFLGGNLVQFISARHAMAQAARTVTANAPSPDTLAVAGTASPPSGQDPGDDRRFGVVPGQAPRFQLSAGEIKALVAETTTTFREYRDNRARVLVNRIMQSNADARTREQLRGLAGHFRVPGFVNFRDNFDPATVVADPVLHCGVFVMWRGKVADVQKGQTAILFKLLVGYDNSPVIQATVPVRLEFAAAIDNGQAIELIGQVEPELPSGGFGLKGSALRLIRGN